MSAHAIPRKLREDLRAYVAAVTAHVLCDESYVLEVLVLVDAMHESRKPIDPRHRLGNIAVQLCCVLEKLAPDAANAAHGARSPFAMWETPGEWYEADVASEATVDRARLLYQGAKLLRRITRYAHKLAMRAAPAVNDSAPIAAGGAS